MAGDHDSVKLPDGVAAGGVRLLVSGEQLTPVMQNGTARFAVKSVLDHEVIVIG